MMEFGTKVFAIKKAENLLKAIGVDVNAEGMRHHLTIVTDDSASVIKVYTPINFAMSSDMLIDIANRIKSLGFFGRRMVKALVSAVNSLSEKDLDDLRTCCFVRQYNAVDAINYFMEWLFATVEANRVKINPKHITFKTARNMWISFGGYRGLKALFTDGLTATIDEFRRLRQVEERLEMASTIDIDNPYLDVDSMREYTLTAITGCTHQCMTCVHCKVDRFGDRICKVGYVDVPESLTVKEVNMIYPSAQIFDCGRITSKYIYFHQTDCECYKSRIGLEIKEDAVEQSVVENELVVTA